MRDARTPRYMRWKCSTNRLLFRLNKHNGASLARLRFSNCNIFDDNVILALASCGANHALTKRLGFSMPTQGPSIGTSGGSCASERRSMSEIKPIKQYIGPDGKPTLTNFGTLEDIKARLRAALMQKQPNQERIACQCGKWLWRSIGGSGQGEGATRYYEYRVDYPGEPITQCPSCGTVLDIGTTGDR